MFAPTAPACSQSITIFADWHDIAVQPGPIRNRRLVCRFLLARRLLQAVTKKGATRAPSGRGRYRFRSAAKTLAELINAAGGIRSLGGAKLKMFYADSESKPEKGVAEAERLAASGGRVIAGHWEEHDLFFLQETGKRLAEIAPDRVALLTAGANVFFGISAHTFYNQFALNSGVYCAVRFGF